MRARTKRLYGVGLAALLVAAAATLAAFALRQHADLFYTPQLLVERGMPDVGERIRIGGFVEKGSLSYGEGAEILFTIVDGSSAFVRVSYVGIVPDLFREGEGVVATGRFLESDSIFTAEQILAKHDETYEPRELRDLEKEQEETYAEKP
ncbi:MAG: cytochrome c maturation protein CcmE [Pseudomonadota bacterium]